LGQHFAHSLACTRDDHDFARKQVGRRKVAESSVIDHRSALLVISTGAARERTPLLPRDKTIFCN
jgi:hypothetical protein